MKKSEQNLTGSLKFRPDLHFDPYKLISTFVKAFVLFLPAILLELTHNVFYRETGSMCKSIGKYFIMND